LHVSKSIFVTYHHMDREVSDLRNVDFGWSILIIVLLVLFLAIVVKFLESVSNFNLTEVHNAVKRSSRWVVTHVYGKSLFIIKRWVSSGDEAFSPQADLWDSSTKDISGSLRFPIIWKKLVHSQ
jgi:hypothetical protein